MANRNQRLSRACIVHLVIKKTNWSYVKTREETIFWLLEKQGWIFLKEGIMNFVVKMLTDPSQ
jgi:hypothetical protein